MKTHSIINTLFFGLLLSSSPLIQAAEFECFPADQILPTTDAIKDALNGAMPFVVREGGNRTSTLTQVSTVTSTGCFIHVRFNAKLERDKKAIKDKKIVTGYADLSGEVNRLNGCLNNPTFDKIEFDDTTKITENLIRNAYNRNMPSELCQASDGSFEL